jgi:hypothetical protein
MAACTGPELPFGIANEDLTGLAVLALAEGLVMQPEVRVLSGQSGSEPHRPYPRRAVRPSPEG